MMQIFLIHRGAERSAALNAAKIMVRKAGVHAKICALRPSYLRNWKRVAKRRISESEVILIYDKEACKKSRHAMWELEQAQLEKKPILEVYANRSNDLALIQLSEVYNDETDFESCFNDQPADSAHLLELYKTMLATSEELIRRRQITNGFFTTVIGGLVTAIGFAFDKGIISQDYVALLALPISAGLILCRSWYRLIDNYGKLNAAKFRVILRLEKELGARIFSAEWIALGSGKRPEKYRPFTSTENSVPVLFGIILFGLGTLALYQTDWLTIINSLSEQSEENGHDGVSYPP